MAQAHYGPDIESPRFYAGRMLLALPGMVDGNFRRAAIAMCVHDEHGAMGLDVGTVIAGLSLAELMGGLGNDAHHLGHVTVMRGGPVEPQRGFVLHGTGWSDEHSNGITDAWRVSASIEILKAIAAGEGPSRFVVTLGYSGWAGGQLEHEMTTHGWFLGGEIPAHLAGIDPGRRWDECFALSGVDARLLAGCAGMA